MDDLKLLNEYVQTGSESAFAQLVNRYSGMVYGVCLRQLKDAALAEDATQAVFLILASKAGELRTNVVVGGWLFQTAKFAASNAFKLEARRKRTEREAVAFKNEKLSDEKTRDALTAAILDETLLRLNADERNVLILRYYRGLELQDIGAALSISADAAEKRVARALEKLKTLFFKEGFVCSLPAIAGVLAANAKVAPPAELALRLARDCALGLHAAGSGAAIAKGTLATMNGFKLKAAIAAISAALLLAGSVGYLGYAAGRSRTPVPGPAAEQPVKAPAPVRVDQADSAAETLFTARVEYARRVLLDEFRQHILEETKAERDRAEAMEKAGQVTRIDVSNAEIGYKTAQLEKMQAARRLADAKSELEARSPNDPLLTHPPAALGADDDLETDEDKRTVTQLEQKDGKVVRKRIVFKPEDLNQAITAALHRRPEAELAEVAELRKRILRSVVELREREAALLLEAQRLHVAISAVKADKISFERGGVTSVELQHAIAEKMKDEGEFVNKRADYLLQLGQLYVILGRDPSTIKLEEEPALDSKVGAPNF